MDNGICYNEFEKRSQNFTNLQSGECRLPEARLPIAQSYRY